MNEQEERLGFELWYKTSSREKRVPRRYPSDRYVSEIAHAQWLAWKARAQMEREFIASVIV